MVPDPEGSAGNPAARLAWLLRSALREGARDPAKPAVDVWARTFGLPPDMDVDERYTEVTRLLGGAFDQLRAVESLARGTRQPQDLYSLHLNRIGNALSPRLLNSGWPNCGKHLGDDTIVAIRMLAATFELEEEPVPPDATEKISEALNELEGLLNEQAVDAQFRRAAMSLVEALRRLTRDYPVCGAESLRVTYRHLIVDWDDLPTARTEPEKKARNKLLAIIGAVSLCVKLALGGVDGLGDFAHSIHEIHTAVPAGQALLGVGKKLLGAGATETQDGSGPSTPDEGASE